MLSNNQIQAALVAYLKGKAVITAQVSSDEIREDQWQGDEFVYPNIRVRLISNAPLGSPDDCKHTKIAASFMVFTEDASSLNADNIAGIIATVLHSKQFFSNTIAFTLRIDNLVPAIRSDARTWRSEVMMSGIASG